MTVVMSRISRLDNQSSANVSRSSGQECFVAHQTAQVSDKALCCENVSVNGAKSEPGEPGQVQYLISVD